jgi:hypothetical protein
MKTTMEILTEVSDFIPTVGLVFIMSRFAEKIGELREAMKRESLAFRALWQPPVDLDYDYKEQDRAHKQRLDTLLQLETSPEQLRKFGRESDERLLHKFPIVLMVVAIISLGAVVLMALV